MTHNQQIFADEYLRNGRNAARAYMTAYPRIKNENSAGAAGCRLLKNVNVKDYIDRQLKKLHTANIADTSEIMAFYTDIMRGAICDKVLIDGDIKDIPVKPSDRISAAEKLAKMLGTDKGIETERLELERKRLELSAGYQNTQENQDQFARLADLINNPVPDANIRDITATSDESGAADE